VTAPAPGANVWLPKPALQSLIDRLRADGYGVTGPRVADGAVTLGEVASLADLPRGVRDEQQPGRYRLAMAEDGGYFDHVNGPHSLKAFLFPPRATVLEVLRVRESWEARVPEPPRPKRAVLGVRSCDLHALAIQDRVFLHGPHPDPEYAARRDGLFLVAVNCSRSVGTGRPFRARADAGGTRRGRRTAETGRGAADAPNQRRDRSRHADE
jgi:sulfhydrogenase subunit beta (sulfur reductase)